MLSCECISNIQVVIRVLLISRQLISIPYVTEGAKHVYNQYVVRVQRRDELRAHLSSRGIGTMVYYPGALHLQPCFSNLKYRKGDFPHAEKACQEVLALPVYPEMPTGAQERVVREICDFFGV